MFHKVLNNMRQVLNMSKFWIWQNSKYRSFLKMRTLHSVLNMPGYAFTVLWIYLEFWICQDSNYGTILNMQKLHQVLFMPQYVWICFNQMWICFNMFEFMIIKMFLNMCHTIHSPRSFYKLVSTYWEIGVFRTMSKILDRALWKNNYSIFKYIRKTLHLKSLRGFCAGL